jgi:hypothetical protein
MEAPVLVHDGGKQQRVKRSEECLVYTLGIPVTALELKRVVGPVPTQVVSAEVEESVGVPILKHLGVERKVQARVPTQCGRGCMERHLGTGVLDRTIGREVRGAWKEFNEKNCTHARKRAGEFGRIGRRIKDTKQ